MRRTFFRLLSFFAWMLRSAQERDSTAVLWAVEQGVTKGTDSTHFSPEKTCSRAEIVTFLQRAAAE